MRKNGINNQLRPISGGVCATEGFKANGVACGIREDGQPDFAMIFSERRCAVACVYATGNTVGAPITVTKRNMRNGYARAILVNSGVAVCVGEEDEKLAKEVCDLLFPYGIERGEIVFASTGKIGKRLDSSPFKRGIASLWEGLSSSHEHSLRAATAIMTEDSFVKQLSYAFDLGDYPCKIGVIFKGGPQISPNMATFLAFLTTDVNISTPMLQKALEAETRETLNGLNLDGISSPNDTVCIMANGKAGNYKIDRMDSEYKKFTRALRAVLTEVCRLTAKDGAKKTLLCEVKGAISKEVARSAAKAIVGSEGIKSSIEKGKADAKSILFVLLERANALKTQSIAIRLCARGKEVVLYEEGRAFSLSDEVTGALLSADEVEIKLDLGEGNFKAKAFGRISP